MYNWEYEDHRLRLDQTYADIIKQREQIVEAFIAETGLKPSEIVQIVEKDINGIRWYLKRKEECKCRQEF